MTKADIVDQIADGTVMVFVVNGRSRHRSRWEITMYGTNWRHVPNESGEPLPHAKDAVTLPWRVAWFE